MPIYACPKCGRQVELPEGKYYCKVCGPSAVMVKLPKEVECRQHADRQIELYEAWVRPLTPEERERVWKVHYEDCMKRNPGDYVTVKNVHGTFVVGEYATASYSGVVDYLRLYGVPDDIIEEYYPKIKTLRHGETLKIPKHHSSPKYPTLEEQVTCSREYIKSYVERVVGDIFGDNVERFEFTGSFAGKSWKPFRPGSDVDVIVWLRDVRKGSRDLSTVERTNPKLLNVCGHKIHFLIYPSTLTYSAMTTTHSSNTQKVEVKPKLVKGVGGSNPKLSAEELEVCQDFLRRLRETGQIYIVGHDVPISISRGLYIFLDELRKKMAKEKGVPEVQYEWEDLLWGLAHLKLKG